MKDWHLYTERQGPFTYSSMDGVSAETMAEWVCKPNSWFITRRHNETVMLRGDSIAYFLAANQNVAF